MQSNGRIRNPDQDEDRLPPHSLEAEQGVLGCILLDADQGFTRCVSAHITRTSFYDLRHQEIWEAMNDVVDRLESIDTITLQECLKTRHQLEAIGGLSYLASLPDAVPSAANLDHYLQIVSEKHHLRRMLAVFTDAASKIFECGSAEDLLAQIREPIRQSLLATAIGSAGTYKTFTELAKFDHRHDPSTLLGVRNDGTTSRYLCRGGGGWLIGPSGIGKSSLFLQMAILWCLGRPAFGIKPTRPLRITIVQAENDVGDIAEMIQGACEGLGIDLEGIEFSEEAEIIEKNLRIRTEGRRTGPEFCQWLRRVVEADQCDIILADPFLSFAGIAVGMQEQCTQFLRTRLNPILQDTGVALLGVHHTGKPARPEKGQRASVTLLDQAYSGIGSSELVNWARLIMSLRCVDEGASRYCLQLVKRGKRAWASYQDGPPSLSIWLQQAQKGIFWEQTDAPREDEPAPEGEPAPPKEPKKSAPDQIAVANLFTFLSACKEEGEGHREIARRMEQWAADEMHLNISEATARRAIDKLIGNRKLRKKSSLYYKGPNA